MVPSVIVIFIGFYGTDEMASERWTSFNEMLQMVSLQSMAKYIDEPRGSAVLLVKHQMQSSNRCTCLWQMFVSPYEPFAFGVPSWHVIAYCV